MSGAKRTPPPALTEERARELEVFIKENRAMQAVLSAFEIFRAAGVETQQAVRSAVLLVSAGIVSTPPEDDDGGASF